MVLYGFWSVSLSGKEKSVHTEFCVTSEFFEEDVMYFHYLHVVCWKDKNGALVIAIISASQDVEPNSCPSVRFLDIQSTVIQHQ